MSKGAIPLFAPESMLILVGLHKRKVQIWKYAEIKVVGSRMSALLVGGTPLSPVHLLALDVHTFLPCHHRLGVKSTLTEELDPNRTNFLIVLRQHLRVWLQQKITPMDGAGAPGCTP